MRRFSIFWILAFAPLQTTAHYDPRGDPLPPGQATVQVAVQATPAGRSFSVDGTTYSTAQTFIWIPGSSHSLTAATPQDGTAGTKYVWVSWSDGGDRTHSVIAPGEDTTYTAAFSTKYHLTVASDECGTTYSSPWASNNDYEPSTSVTVTAKPWGGCAFNGWSGSGAGSYSGPDNPATIVMNGPVTQTANYTFLSCWFALALQNGTWFDGYPRTVFMPAGGGSGTLTVVSNRSSCWWMASGGWGLAIDYREGFPDVRYYVERNQGLRRTVTARIAELTFTVEQGGTAEFSTDFNQDGQPDMIWYNSLTAEVVEWTMVGSSRWYTQRPLGKVMTDPYWRLAATADINGDGAPDIIWRHTLTGQNRAWLSDAGYWNDADLERVDDPQWAIAATADFDADGHPDLLWRHRQTGQNTIWYMDGTVHRASADLIRVPDPNWAVGGAQDMNADGHPDVVWRNRQTGENVVWYLDDATYLSYEYLPSLPDPAWSIAMMADFNNDRHPDLVWRNYVTGQNAIWYLDGARLLRYTWIESQPDVDWHILQGPPPAPPTPGDFTRDGKPDILWRNRATGENIVWKMNGAAYAKYVRLDTVADTAWSSLGTGDFNHDGEQDIFWRNGLTGENRIWYMNGTGCIGQAPVDTVPVEWRMSALADFNEDGQIDLLWRNATTGENIIWFMNDANYAGYDRVSNVPDTNWRIVSATDFNADGRPDIFWRNDATGENIVWFMNGAGYVSYDRVLANADTNWKAVMAADFNTDGKPDILWRNSVTGENIIWFLNGVTYVSYERVMMVADTNWKIGQQQ